MTLEMAMELEVSYNENYCMESRVERRRGATDRDDGGGQAVGMACVDRHIFFITPLMVCLRGRSLCSARGFRQGNVARAQTKTGIFRTLDLGTP